MPISAKDSTGTPQTVKLLVDTVGDPADASATTDTGTFSLISLTKRFAGYLATLAGEDFATEATLASAIKSEDSPAVSGDKGVPMLAMRQLADTTSTDTDGDYTLLKIDEEGRLKVASKPASYPDITGDINAVQAVISTPVAGGTVGGDVTRSSNIMAFCTGTFAGVNVTFEGSLEASGDTNWFGIQAIRSNANIIETTTGVLAAQPAYAWELSVNALARIRVRCTARTSGTQSWRFKQGTYATEPIPGAQASATQPVSFTQAALPAGTALMGDVGGGVRATAGGLALNVRILSAAATTNGTVVKASAGRLYKIRGYNAKDSVVYLKLSNSTTITVGTTAVVDTIALRPSDVFDIDFGANGRYFSTGICFGLTTGSADNDTGALVAGDVLGLNVFHA